MQTYSKPLYNDFTGFTFNGRHSSEFGLLRVSNGDRYEDILVPSLSNETSETPGGPGEYYSGETIKSGNFEIPVAYDNIGELEKRKIKHWLHPDDQLHELVFDEKPYVKYWVKCDKKVVASELCFNEDYNGKTKRIYKGEMQLSFFAPMPYGVAVSKDLEQFNPENSEALYPRDNFDEWKDSSGLVEMASSGLDIFVNNRAKVYNGGDVPVGFELQFKTLPRKYELKNPSEPQTLSQVPQIYNGKIGKYNETEEGYDNIKEVQPFIYENGIKYGYDITNLEYPYVNFIKDGTNLEDEYIIKGQLIIENETTKFESFSNGEIYDIMVLKDDKSGIIYECDNAEGLEIGMCIYAIKKEVSSFYLTVSSRAQINNITKMEQNYKIVLVYLDSELEGDVYISNLYNGEIEFKLNNDTKLKLIYPTAAVINPKDWTIAQKASFWGGKYKIDTNKKTIGYITSEEQIGTIPSYEWKGINGIISEGSLFKLPSSALEQISTENFVFSTLSITTNNIELNGDPTISYQYLYI